MAESRERPPDRVSILDPEYRNDLTVDKTTGRLFCQGKEIVARKTLDFTGIDQVWGWFAAVAIAVGGIGAAATGVVDVYKGLYPEPSVDNKSIASIAAATSSIATKLQALIDQSKEPLPVDNASFEKVAAAAATIAANSTELLKKLEQPAKPDEPPSQSIIYFETGLFTLQAGSNAVLGEWVEFLAAHRSARIEIQAYTDNTGKVGENLALSTQRASAVAGELVGRGVWPAQLGCKGFGAANPIADNNTKDGRDRNRRVEFVYLQGQQQPSGTCTFPSR
mgnify:FL=1